MTATAPDGDLHDVVEDRLRRADQRYTSGRRAIIGLLVDAGHPVSIGDIADRLPDLPRSSAYRHLLDLQVAGVVRRVAANDEFARYELAEELTEHHHHLLCTHCGKVIDVTPSPPSNATWPPPSRSLPGGRVPAPQPPPRHPGTLPGLLLEPRHLRRGGAARPGRPSGARSGRSSVWWCLVAA